MVLSFKPLAAAMLVIASVVCNSVKDNEVHSTAPQLCGDTTVAQIALIRHGDKMSKYPSCKKQPRDWLCYDVDTYGNNPALSPCGRSQARYVAEALVESDHPVIEIVSSPYLRTLQTALPLSHITGVKVQVEPLMSEDRQLTDPFRATRHACIIRYSQRLGGRVAAWDCPFWSSDSHA